MLCVGMHTGRLCLPFVKNEAWIYELNGNETEAR